MENIKPLIRQLAKPLLFLLLFIMICAFLARYLTGEETLLEYAQNNPELAYGTQEAADSEESSTKELPTNSVNIPVSEATSPSSSDKTDVDPGIIENDPTVTRDKSPAYDDDNSSESVEENQTMSEHPERTIYKEGFYYEPLTNEVKDRITGISYPESGCTVPYEDLAYVGLLYFDFDGKEQSGELICNRAVAQDMVEIFYELYRNDYRIERICLIDEYDGDDTASMADNNTSCFNYRVVDGTTSLSKHAYGLAIDVNPYYNPYVVYNKNGDGSTYISPPGSEVYADRSQNFAYKIDENDLCYRLFTEHGFTWGGNWNSTKDYQHFQKTLN